ncbi:MAG: hypothetical protein LBT89_00020, partial [Planctomycetaceae bacterium]|nr:hypothetical protein [Planctomycetaceae bacterium]
MSQNNEVPLEGSQPPAAGVGMSAPLPPNEYDAGVAAGPGYAAEQPVYAPEPGFAQQPAYAPAGDAYYQQTNLSNELLHHQRPPRSAPILDPVESSRMTPQILVLLLVSGLKRHWKWSLPLAIFLSLFTAGILYLAFPAKYTAQAWIRIFSEKPKFIYDEKTQVKYDEYVNTQFALMRSLTILEKALENADVAKLPCIIRERDKAGWLAKQLIIKTDGKSEIVIVSIACNLPDEAEKIVNAVVDAYFEYYNLQSQDSSNHLIRQLNAEMSRQTSLAHFYQDAIRSKIEKAALQGAAAGQEGMAAGIGQGESLMRDAALAENRLIGLRAEQKMYKETLEHPENIPQSMLYQAIQNDPELQALNLKLDAARARKEELKPILTRPDDPRIKNLDTQIADMEKSIKDLLEGAKNTKGQSIQLGIRANIEQQIWERTMQIRTAEIQVQELQQKYKEQLDKSSTRSTSIADVTFDQASLGRINKVLDALSERLVTLAAERFAPEQITLQRRATTPVAPDMMKQLMMVCAGAVGMFCFPLLLGIAVERMKPRLYHVSQIRRAMPQVLIGEIMEPPVSWVHGGTFRKRMARYRESVHNWCTHLLLSDPFRRCKTLSVASVAGDDGKTFLAVQIAVAMAQMKSGPVLLIDADMRVGRLHLLFGNEETGLGLADVLSFRNGFGEAVVTNEKEPNLHLLSAGQLDSDPYELLGDGRFRELLDMLEQHYSLVLIVLPPVA